MAATEELSRFVRQALVQGHKRPQIEQVLAQAGWLPDQVKDAMNAYAELEFPLPVPRPRPYLSARETFLYLVLFSALYTSAFNLGNLLFQFIDRAFPDAVLPQEQMILQSQAAVRWSISYLVVAFPLFLYVSRLIGCAIDLDPGKAFSKVRRWLTYLTLFVAAGVLTGDLVALIYNFLGGELGVRFGLKVLAIGVIAGAIFFYYLRDLQSEEKGPDR